MAVPRIPGKVARPPAILTPATRPLTVRDVTKRAPRHPLRNDVAGLGAVADGIGARQVRAHLTVDGDGARLADLDAGCGSEIDAGTHADRRQHQIGADPAAIAQLDTALDHSRRRDAGHHFDAVLGELISDRFADPRIEGREAVAACASTSVTAIPLSQAVSAISRPI